MVTGKLGAMHTSVYNAPQPTEPQPTGQVGGSQVQPKNENVISTIDRIKRFKKRVGSVIKERAQKSAKTNPKNKKATCKKHSLCVKGVHLVKYVLNRRLSKNKAKLI